MSIIHQIALTCIDNVGHVHAKKLLDHFGSAEAIFQAKEKELLAVEGIGKITVRHILSETALRRAESQIIFLERQDVQILFYTDECYPHRLRHCFDAPVLLYYKGNANLNHPRIISIVGTRQCTDYGRLLCKQLSEGLAAYDVIVASGLAYGIDVAAHKESLRQEIPTIGVLAHGLDRIYPQVHQSVAHQMVQRGGLLTEFPPQTNPDRENFPQRNRIIAGISDATIVVEAARRGGALITAEIANSYSRDVYAFPGRTTDRSSEGCNFLIKTHRAGLINNAEDLITWMGWEKSAPVKPGQTSLLIDLKPEEHKIVSVLQQASLRIDELAVRVELPQSMLAIHLLNLEMQGILSALPGKVYRLN